MEESKSVSINLDAKSIEVLRKVDAIHRDSVINIGLALVQKTGYYKTLAGISDKDSDLEDVASLDIEDEPGTTKTKTTKTSSQKEETPKKPAASWDAF